MPTATAAVLSANHEPFVLEQIEAWLVPRAPAAARDEQVGANSLTSTSRGAN